MGMTTFTLQHRDKTSATVLDERGRAVGHVGLIAGGSMTYLNGAKSFGFAFAAHTHDFDVALAIFTRMVDEGVKEVL